jgi:iron(III) transport system substrate-binding protein
MCVTNQEVTVNSLVNRRRFLSGAAVLASTVQASGPLFAQGAAPASGSASVWPYLNGLAKAERMTVLQREAAREGRIVIYGALGIDRAEVFTKPFMARYPKIKVDFVRLREPELVERTNLEVRAGRPGGDLAISNVPWLDLLKNSLAGYVPTTWDQFESEYRFGGASEGWTAVAYEALPSTIAWRTDRVSAAEAPKDLEAVANPKWKGKAGTTSHLEAMMDGLQAAMGEAKANAIIDRLAALDNKLYPSIAALSDALSAGEIDVAWNFGAHRPVRLKAQGAPVDFVFQDPMLALGITASVIKGAPNSYGAALLMEYITETATLQALDKAEGGRIFGIKGATFTIDAAKLPKVTFFRSIKEERFAQLRSVAEAKFLRRR